MDLTDGEWQWIVKVKKLCSVVRWPVLASWCYCYLQDVAYWSKRRCSDVLKAIGLSVSFQVTEELPF